MFGVFGLVLNWLTSGPLDRILSSIDKHGSDLTEREKIKAETIQTYVNAQASTISTGMHSKLFWIPWLIAAIPTAAWYGWGMLDSLCGGTLPHVATLPPQLKEYADIVWQNLFLTGGIVAGSGVIASAIRRKG
ncbi:hypothetical protein EN788_22130 [Mesorhizobium sp. M2D.F.Ca.ET.145.01.1.1]|uniref:hypothetical protein n=1 Tax=unclassified Mesorhizobium TaxID=325217 RepID=UPI000FCA3D09|nr:MULTISPECIES: hypothetical protein [unclassified Mesorhizobium]TGU44617.1 hypothetical protein EN789_21680 [bacterium M00.F.Ca.ET.146.01.1.1]TGU58445.1 hypothetical protein EN791_021680 [Mesorhizobium sp. M2D.F.Ca.ET.148.01.1.1]TGU64377.1 hypothetical protein EN790_21675 [Mesorhizobium sp. M2D.F.Ca.ET.147.01.1.1]TGW09953.1 hypothetical protein EN788_22130 [Mesorhizobium sp. M2D.F.Ca.ET.145.01.1.1]